MNWRGAAIDAVGLLGVAAIVNGVRLIYVPAAWLVGGALAVAFAVLASGRRP